METVSRQSAAKIRDMLVTTGRIANTPSAAGETKLAWTTPTGCAQGGRRASSALRAPPTASRTDAAQILVRGASSGAASIMPSAALCRRACHVWMTIDGIAQGGAHARTTARSAPPHAAAPPRIIDATSARVCIMRSAACTRATAQTRTSGSARGPIIGSSAALSTKNASSPAAVEAHAKIYLVASSGAAWTSPNAGRCPSHSAPIATSGAALAGSRAAATTTSARRAAAAPTQLTAASSAPSTTTPSAAALCPTVDSPSCRTTADMHTTCTRTHEHASDEPQLTCTRTHEHASDERFPYLTPCTGTSDASWLCPHTWETCSDADAECSTTRCCVNAEFGCYEKVAGQARCLRHGTCESYWAGQGASCARLSTNGARIVTAPTSDNGAPPAAPDGNKMLQQHVDSLAIAVVVCASVGSALACALALCVFRYCYADEFAAMREQRRHRRGADTVRLRDSCQTSPGSV